MKILTPSLKISIICLITLGISLALTGNSYSDEFTVTLGEDKVFTTCNYRYTYTKAAPYYLWKAAPRIMEAISEGKTATAHILAERQQEGLAIADVGVKFLVEEGSGGLEEAEAEILIKLNYELRVDFNVPSPEEGGGGSADAIVYGITTEDDTLIERINFLHYSNFGQKSGIKTLKLTAILALDQVYQVFSEVYAYADIYDQGYADSYARTTIEEVRINFILPLPEEKPYLGEPKDENVQVGADPINITNGNLFSTHQDLFIPTIELPLQFIRTYNSRDDYFGPLGYGWTHSYNINLSENLDGSIILMDEDGTRLKFTPDSPGSYLPPKEERSQLTKNPDGSFTLTRKHGIRYNFNSQGKLTSVLDRNDNEIIFTYNAAGLVTTISDTSGRTVTLIYDADNRLYGVIDPAGRLAAEYSYNNGNLVEVKDALGNITRFDYDTNHNLITITDANGNHTYFNYDDEDRVIQSSSDAGNYQITLNYDPDNLKTTVTDSRGNETIYFYNEDGLSIKIIDALGYVTEYSWDEDLNKTSVTDASGYTTSFNYDEKGNLLTITDPQNNTTIFTYEPDFNFVSSITDPLTHTTTYTYDEKGNLTQTQDALGNTTTYTYDTYGNLISLTDAKGNQTDYQYDNYGNLIQVSDPLGNQTRFTYDLSGNLTKITDAKGNSTKFIYDNLNRIIKITYADESQIIYTYDAVGNRTAITDPKGNITQYLYDEVNRLIQVTDPEANTTTYAYDTEGNRISITDAKGNTTAYHYDSLNRLIKVISPLGKEKSFTYDAVGNRISLTDANANTTSYTYDSLNRLIRITYPDNSQVSFDYDAGGKRISMTDNQGTTSYTYDELNRLVKVDGPQDKNTITYKYDAVGNRTKMTNQDSDITTYSYDALNRLTKLTDPWGKQTTYIYDEVSNLTQMNYPNKAHTKYTFDNLNRLIKLTNKTSTRKIISSYRYKYSLTGMRRKVTLANGDYIKYHYDVLNRLTKEAKYSKKGHLRYSYEYTFDGVGNRIQMKRVPVKVKFWIEYGKYLKEIGGRLRREIEQEIGLDQGMIDTYLSGELSPEAGNTYPTHRARPIILTTYTYNADNQLIEEEEGLKWRGRFIKLRITTYTYDAHGNLTEKKITIPRRQREKETTYTYDYENRLTKITYPDNTTSNYTYDGVGKRTEAEKDGKITKYLYDGLNVIIERDYYNYTKATYTRGLSYGGGIGSIISRKHPMKGNTYYHYDGLGNVTALTGDFGKIQQRYTYDAYGNLLSIQRSRPHRHSRKTILNPYLFSTKEYSPKSGLYYFGARYYDPRVGRFLQKDPYTWSLDDKRFLGRQVSTSYLLQRAITQTGGIVNPPNILTDSLKRFREITILSTGEFFPQHFHRYAYVTNNPINLLDPFGLWYIDINISVGYKGGMTFGAMINNNGIYPYAGGGVMTPPGGAAVTWSPDDPSTGWNIAAQGGYWGGGQAGYGFGEGGRSYWEAGFVTPGFSLTGFYVWEYEYPWRRGRKK